jgi:ABC-type proline/glycine betaine transport system ATPase subunit
MDKGQIVEFASPQELLSNPNSLFSHLAKKSQKKTLSNNSHNNSHNNNNNNVEDQNKHTT